MDYLKTIVTIFENHEISKYSELKYEQFNKSEKYPLSEGIIFESLDFAGEIFYYKNMEYCEMEFLIFKNEKHKFKIIEKPNLTELRKEITEFLNKNTIELKNVA